MIEKGRTLKTAKELEEMGFGLVIWPLSSFYITAKAVRDLMKALKEEGTAANMMDKMIPLLSLTNLSAFEIDDIKTGLSGRLGERTTWKGREDICLGGQF